VVKADVRRVRSRGRRPGPGLAGPPSRMRKDLNLHGVLRPHGGCCGKWRLAGRTEVLERLKPAWGPSADSGAFAPGVCPPPLDGRCADCGAEADEQSQSHPRGDRRPVRDWNASPFGVRQTASPCSALRVLEPRPANELEAQGGLGSANAIRARSNGTRQETPFRPQTFQSV
jgi:hypothetical protein